VRARHNGWRMLRDTLLLTAVVALVTALATAFGAANLGTALGIAQIVFAVALTGLLATRR
jgi:uncharacterized membrane protein YtjA (UPF0391 family)